MKASTAAYERSLRGVASSDSCAGLVAATELGMRSLGAEGVSMGFLDPGAKSEIKQTAVGFSETLASSYARLSESDPLPGPFTMLTHEPLFLNDRDTTLEQFPAARPILDGSRFEAAACLPLIADDGRSVGYVAAHWRKTHRFNGAESGLLRRLAATCSGAASRLGRPGEDVDQLRAQVEGHKITTLKRAQIEQAKGMLMQRYGLSSQAAWQVLRRLSSTSNTTMPQVAELLVAGDPITGLNGCFVGETTFETNLDGP